MSTTIRRNARLIALALPLTTCGCYTIFHHPARIASLGTDTGEAVPSGTGYFPYSPTVWGWYYGHYGAYWNYYARPWWLDHLYYPDEDGFAPLPRAPGFGRGGRGGGAAGGRGGFANPQTLAPLEGSGEPPRQGGSTTSSTSGASEEAPDSSSGSGAEKPRKPEKAEVGGRGGRR